MPIIEIIGFIAAFLTTISFLPQAVLVIRTRNTSGLSLGMYVLFTTGVFLWLIYGFIVESWPVAIANSVTFIFAASILFILVLNRFQKRDDS